MSGYEGLFSLEGKTAVVTGGSGYLGREIVKGLLDFGSLVTVIDYIPPTGLTSERLQFIECDLGDTSLVAAAFKEATSSWGGSLNTLITLAADRGVGVANDIENIDDECWDSGLSAVISLTFRTIREALPYLKNSGNASIINIGSLYAVSAPDPRTYLDTPFSSSPAYGAGKAATLELTRYCAAYLAKYGIRANSVSPGSYPHPNVYENELFKKRLAAKTMLGRIGYPEDLVGAMVFLASDASRYVTGINIMVDGGQTSW